MATVKVKFRSSQHTIVCEDAQKVEGLAKKVDARACNLKLPPTAPDLKVAILSMILMQDEIEELNAQLGDKQKEISLADNLNYISTYLEDMSKKMKKG
jgi:cell division protein ZapA (FtsZ GTPase activity inhibitor)